MVNRERLKRAGLRAYELGRLRAALRAAWVVIPLVAVCAVVTGAHEACSCAGVLLLGLAVFLRWRSRRGGEGVTSGLLAGVWPLLAGLIVARVAPSCAGAPLISACTASCLSCALPAGLWLGFRTARRRNQPASWLGAAGISILAASLGFAGLGLAGVFGAALGLAFGALAASLFARRQLA